MLNLLYTKKETEKQAGDEKITSLLGVIGAKPQNLLFSQNLIFVPSCFLCISMARASVLDVAQSPPKEMML
jgi:hypothetical protein